jgi:hypothetical protein
MSIELTEDQTIELEKIVQEMNKQAEMALLYDEGTKEHEEHLKRLLEYKEKVNNMEPHAKTFVQQGLLDNKDIHDFYWPQLEARYCMRSRGLSTLERRKGPSQT